MDKLFEKIYGSIAGFNTVVALAYPTEGMHWREIEKKYGKITKMISVREEERIVHRERGPAWHKKPMEHTAGMTEDGAERHRLVCTAIIEKGGRVTVEDVAKIWVRDINPDKFGYLLGNQDRIIYDLFKAGFPPPDVGRYVPWPGLIGTSKQVHPIGIINAGDPRQAALDAFDITRLRDTRYRPENHSLEVAAAVAAATAEAFNPEATVESLIKTALNVLSAPARSQVTENLTTAQQEYQNDYLKVREYFHEKYAHGHASNAIEALSEAMVLLRMYDANIEQIGIGAANFGRDGECLGGTAAGIAGALRGINSVPDQWVQTVENTLKKDSYTVSNRSLRETAVELYKALQNEITKKKQQISMLQSQIE